MPSFSLAAWFTVSSLLLGGSLSAENVLVIESSPNLQGPDGMGTAAYLPTKAELPFTKRITEKPINLEFGSSSKIPKADNETEAEWKKDQAETAAEEAKMIQIKDYTLAGQVGSYVGWYGILRAEHYDPATKCTTWTVQHTYADGLCDLRLEIVSIFGAGDFYVEIPGDHTQVPLLDLIRAYGTVRKGGSNVPVFTAEYVRTWAWGLFTFMDYGLDKSNPAWIKLRAITPEEIYSFRPDKAYYEARLGHRNSK